MKNQWKENLRNSPSTLKVIPPTPSKGGGQFINVQEGLNYMDNWEKFTDIFNELLHLTKDSLSIIINIQRIIQIQKELSCIQLIQFETFGDPKFLKELKLKIKECNKLRIAIGINDNPNNPVLKQINDMNQKKDINEFNKTKIGNLVIVTE